MSDSIRQELVQVLAELSEIIPELRMGQLIVNLSYQARGLSDSSTWDVEDSELLTVARQQLEEWRARRSVPA